MSTISRPLQRSMPTLSIRSAGLMIISDRCFLEIPSTAHTLGGFRQWATAEDFPEHVRVTFLAGEIIIDMSNEDVVAHVSVKTEIGRVLSTLVLDERLGMFFGDGLLLSNVPAEVSNNPDSSFLSRETIQSGRARIIHRRGVGHLGRELEGTPDWVLEVISDSSVRKDTVRLRDAYHRAGIAEYWIVDARGDEVVFQILLRRKNHYVSAKCKDGWQRSKVFGRWFRLERFLNDLGLWQFTLHVREE